MTSQEIMPLKEGQINVTSGAVHHGVQVMILLITDPDKTKVAVLVSMVCTKHNMMQTIWTEAMQEAAAEVEGMVEGMLAEAEVHTDVTQLSASNCIVLMLK